MTGIDTSSLPTPSFTSDDLTDDQRAWIPATTDEAWDQWPSYFKVEMWTDNDRGRGLHYQNGDDSWDWRSVAVAARAFPGWHIVLWNGGGLSAYAPSAEQA